MMPRWAFSRQISDALTHERLRQRTVRMRSARARASLDSIQIGGARPAQGARAAPGALGFGHMARGVAVRLAAHAWLILFVLLVVAGEVIGGWSAGLIGARPTSGAPVRGGQAARLAGDSSGQIIAAPSSSGAAVRFAVRTAPAALIAPAPSVPLAISDAFRETHEIAAGETLGGIAHRYGVSLASIIWSNGLDRGDALALGQPLRIPRVSGSPHLIAAGETVEAIAARFGVSPEAIRTFGPNHLQGGGDLVVGQEIFVPGGDMPLPEVLLAQGGADGLAARGAEPAGMVREDETNLREGPGTDYGRRAQIDSGRQVALRARHGDWLKVEIAGVAGWVRADLLQIAGGLADDLPETDDFPPPPPRWVWPSWGELSSGFGARWGSFHNGIDIANRAWTPIRAARAGRVREAGWCSGYGYCVKISHGGGVETIYGHMVTSPSVAAGDEVSAGQRIGSMGSTYDRAGGGYSTGVHLHFTVLVNGRAVNPLTVLP